MWEYAVSAGPGTLGIYGICDEEEASRMASDMAYKYEGPLVSCENGCIVVEGELWGDDEAEMWGFGSMSVFGEASPILILYLRPFCRVAR